MKKRPIIIGLTGSIGMGKSTTGNMFAELGIPVWDADKSVAGLYVAGGAGTEAIGQILPEAIGENGVDRDMLKTLIKQNPDTLKQIERVVHPLVKEDRKQFLKENSDVLMVVLDIPLLFENGSEKTVDKVVVVSTNSAQQRERVLSRGTMDEATFDMILAKQTPDAEKRARADYVVLTTTIEHARGQVQKIVAELQGV